jgi:lysophospholipase L1-like esterase
MFRRFCPLAVSGLMLLLIAAPAAQAAQHAKPRPQPKFFLSLGDSYSVGFQNGSVNSTTTHGPANQLLPLAAQRGYRFKLVNLGCGGATTTSMLKQINCKAQALAPGAAGYPNMTQTQAAVAFIKRHPGRVGLVTISIGGNDVDGCVAAKDQLGCVITNMVTARANLTRIVKQLRSAGGKLMRIVGSTYPDVILGAWVRTDVFGSPGGFNLAIQSLTSFDRYINPGLKRAYDSVGASFVDVTAATGAYGRFDTTNLPPYGLIPTPVAKVCELTYFCQDLGIHMTTAGYHIIAKLEAATLPKLN